jgi:MoaA/NifB/PqqE/SkfB family radical SAM enzyme
VKDLLVADPGVDTVTVALNYRCNSRCRFCFIERELDMDLPDTGDAFLAAVFAENKRRGGLYRRIIFSGAECTLRPDLADVARRARADGGFEVVQIQTNGRRLADAAYLRSLVDAGIGEYFVSVHAPTAELDAYLTRAPKSFEEMRAGMKNVRALGATLISNSVVSRGNHRQLPELADFLIAEEVPECHFWAFIEFGDIAQHDEHVRLPEAAPFVREAVARLRAASREVFLSWFPECLLGEHADRVRHHRATLLIHDAFSARAADHGRFVCPHDARCARFGTSCYGLHERYVAVFGDERDALVPLAGPGGAAVGSFKRRLPLRR